MRATRSGITLLELIIAVAMIGILVAVAATSLNFAGVATRQASQAITSATNAARLTAVRSNETIGLTFVPSAGSTTAALRVCRNVDTAAAPLACPTGAASSETVLDFGVGELQRIRMTVNNANDPSTVFFDRRGVLRNPAQFTVEITDASGGNARTLDLLATGRFDVR